LGGASAESEFQRALALNQNYATVIHWLVWDLAAMAGFPEALL